MLQLGFGLNLFFAPLTDVGLDIQDEMGRHEVGFVENTSKDPLNGGKGCLFTSTFYINKVPGTWKWKIAL
jgi:hypothetical protein